MNNELCECVLSAIVIVENDDDGAVMKRVVVAVVVHVAACVVQTFLTQLSSVDLLLRL